MKCSGIVDLLAALALQHASGKETAEVPRKNM